MFKHPLILVLKQLPNSDIRQLKIYLQNQHDDNSKINNLFQSIVTKIKLKQSFNIEDIFKDVYTNEAFKSNKIRVLISQLTIEVEDFLVFREIKKDEVGYKLKLLSIYRKLGANKAFESQISKTKKLFIQENSESIEQYFYQYQQNKQLYWHFGEQKRDAEESIIRMFESFEQYQILEYLRLMCFAISAQVEIEESKKVLANMAIELARKDYYQKVDLIQAYNLIYHGFLDTSNVSYYNDLKILLYKKGNLFAKEDLRILTLLVINYTIRKYNNGHAKFLNEMFYNYKLGIENGALFSDQQELSRWTFQNIVSIGLLLNEIEWTENFINEFKDQINSENKESVYTYNLSKLFYKKKDFRSAILHLQEIDSKDALEMLNAKALLLRIYYEEQEWEALINLLNSFQRYVSRQKQIGYQKKAFLNLIRFTNRLVNVRTGNQQQLLNFKKRVQKAETLADKHWLLEQVEQLL